MKRLLFILAGLAALAVTLIRGIAGGEGDLALLLAALEGNPIRGVVIINWHALTAVFGLLAVALFFSAWLSRPVGVIVGLLAAGTFGTTCALFMAVAAAETGSPFTYFPYIPLGITATLSFLAALSAGMGRR
ncbi:hypothetical protein F3N42_11050 [Marinihelvus fidelis]|uniref:Uncharacterized protein n=1 Tax=Marinihelvus fidelis TaxID=2613842 RepID=A0A5N0T7Z8_9GAMM|nr:hypothetical protein [Marinihelvus fidelis]KAA9130891.1 hypothetical protein F3N42_11050 [Marinihelvus fidelis]